MVGASKSTEAAEVSAVPGWSARRRPRAARRAAGCAARRPRRTGRPGRARSTWRPASRASRAAAKSGVVSGRRQRVEVGALVAAELHAEHHQRAADRVDVGGHARPDLGHLGRLVADRAVDRGVLVVDAAYAAEVDQLHRVADLDQVVGLEVAVDQPEVVEVLERRQHLEHVGERLVDRQRVVGAVVVAHPLLEDLLERRAADVLHDDVAGALVGDEVVDLDDQRVLDLGEELLLGDRGRQRVGVAGVEQALHHHPAVGDVAVAREVDPAQPAVGQRSGHLVLPGHEVAGPELGRERELLAALGAEPLLATGLPVAAAADRGAALGAGALVLGHDGVGVDGLGRVDRRRRRHPGQPGAEPRRPHPLRAGAGASGGRGAVGRPRRAERRGLHLARRRRDRDLAPPAAPPRRRRAAGGEPPPAAAAIPHTSQ